ncbi:hypothetical protein [Nostoc sp. KVJ3]|nr:hypothetical protein [Nostoc sp. KVJ3]
MQEDGASVLDSIFGAIAVQLVVVRSSFIRKLGLKPRASSTALY